MEFDELHKIKRPEQTHKAGSSEQTGFPSPATHYLESTLDLNLILTKNRDATFFIRVKGNGWSEYTIRDQDVLIIDRSLHAALGKLAVVVRDGDFKVERITKLTEKDSEVMLWGVITYIIHAL
ncbi:S24 family peptidase [Leeuwenhoekiella sp. W20_SRS_FM14]|uniref:S24 family peptidase n=1 Tax=Leeuwenhoekiella sp. W20_SRS_FM14 TaxID=3240270 RepID=UPI003F9AF6DE